MLRSSAPVPSSSALIGGGSSMPMNIPAQQAALQIHTAGLLGSAALSGGGSSRRAGGGSSGKRRKDQQRVGSVGSSVMRGLCAEESPSPSSGDEAAAAAAETAERFAQGDSEEDDDASPPSASSGVLPSSSYTALPRHSRSRSKRLSRGDSHTGSVGRAYSGLEDIHPPTLSTQQPLSSKTQHQQQQQQPLADISNTLLLRQGTSRANVGAKNFHAATTSSSTRVRAVVAPTHPLPVSAPPASLSTALPSMMSLDEQHYGSLLSTATASASTVLEAEGEGEGMDESDTVPASVAALNASTDSRCSTSAHSAASVGGSASKALGALDLSASASSTKSLSRTLPASSLLPSASPSSDAGVGGEEDPLSSSPEIHGTTAGSTLTGRAGSMSLDLELDEDDEEVRALSLQALAPVTLLPAAPTLAASSAAAASSSAAASAAAHPTNAWSAHLLAQQQLQQKQQSSSASASAASPSSASLSLVPLASEPTDEYSDAILGHLLLAEAKYMPSAGYMESVQNDLSFFMRSILMDWLVEVCEEYSLASQTLFLTVNYVDRFLSAYPVDRAKLQLLGVAAMLAASKFWEIRAPTIDDFIYISDSTYTREQVLQMESALLGTLQFALMAVTPWDCSTRISRKMGRDILPEKTEFLAEMMMELFILEQQYLQYRPSVIAASALFLALYTTHANPWPSELESACSLTVEGIQLCVRAMHAAYLRMCQHPSGFVAQAGVPPLLAIRDKFSHARYCGVADIQPRML